MTTTAAARPILFSGPMVRAILEGRKTQTRRVVKFSDEIVRLSSNDEFRARSPYPLAADTSGRYHYVISSVGAVGLPCPYGKPGDRLWVRETWKAHARFRNGMKPHSGCVVWYCADGVAPAQQRFGRGRSPRFMPRWASRITLDLMEVRVQRLQEITATDIRAEGIIAQPCTVAQMADALKTERAEFIALWDRLNGKDSWHANPWIWALTFRVVPQEMASVDIPDNAHAE